MGRGKGFGVGAHFGFWRSSERSCEQFENLPDGIPLVPNRVPTSRGVVADPNRARPEVLQLAMSTRTWSPRGDVVSPHFDPGYADYEAFPGQ